MRQLREDEMIDILFGEPHDAELEARLASCEFSKEEMAVLQDGLEAAKRAEPKMPIILQQPITHVAYKRRLSTRRWTWLAVAAMFAIAFVGLRVQVGGGVMTLEFALFSDSSVSDARVDELEQQLAIAMQAIEMQSDLTQQQIDARLNALYMERSEEIETFRVLLDRKMQDTDLKQQRYFVTLEDRLMESLRKQSAQGKIQ